MGPEQLPVSAPAGARDSRVVGGPDDTHAARDASPVAGAGFGATSAEWQHFVGLGLFADLLPVVSNPNARIAAKSTLKQLGKTPSKYDKERQVWGIADWTTKKSTQQDVALWSRQPDYG